MPADHPITGSSNEACAICARDQRCAECFDELMARLQAPMLHYLQRRARTRQDAEDILQETFLSAFRKLHQYDPTWKFSTWIFTIASRLLIDSSRKVKREVPSESAGETLADWNDPHRSVSETEQRTSLWRVAKQVLDTDSYTALWLTYVEQMTSDEVAKVIDRNGNAVRILLTRARAKLAEKLPESFRPERTGS